MQSAKIAGKPQDWSGSLRRHFYLDVVLYLIFLGLFCGVEFASMERLRYDGYRLVQSVQSTLLTTVCPSSLMRSFCVIEVDLLQRQYI